MGKRSTGAFWRLGLASKVELAPALLVELRSKPDSINSIMKT
jgi:hypothetical protein